MKWESKNEENEIFLQGVRKESRLGVWMLLILDFERTIQIESGQLELYVSDEQ